MPKTLYLQKEFCGLEPGAEFKFGVLAGDESYQHEGFVVPAEQASENEEWFSATRPRVARMGAGAGEHDDEDS